jgi:DNA-binding response OmpR family regulator
MKTVLYVDDDYNSLLLVKEQLKLINPDIKVITESRGEDAIDTFKDYINDIDLVIADIQIPNVNGYDLLLMVKKLKPETPVIMLTASNYNRENDYVIKKLGASEYLLKPLSKRFLSDIIEKY